MLAKVEKKPFKVSRHYVFYRNFSTLFNIFNNCAKDLLFSGTVRLFTWLKSPFTLNIFGLVKLFRKLTPFHSQIEQKFNRFEQKYVRIEQNVESKIELNKLKLN